MSLLGLSITRKMLPVVLLGCSLVLQGQENWRVLITDTSSTKRIQAARELGVSATAEQVMAVIELLDDIDPFVRSEARSAMLRMGEPATAHLKELIKSTNGALRTATANRLLNLLGRTDGLKELAISPDVEEDLLQDISFARCLDGACLERWVRPRYFNQARMDSISGRVWVTFTININGAPEIIFANGHPLLVLTALEAIKNWHFTLEGNAGGKIRSILFEYRLVGDADHSRDVAVDMLFPNYVAVVGRPMRAIID